MTKRECFIDEITELLKNEPDILSTDAREFFEQWKEEAPGKSAVAITENGMKILDFMKENHQKYNNVFKAKEIAEGLFTSGRSVSGSMRKLVSDGYVEKIGKDPVAYAITEKGKSFSLT